MRLWVDTDIGDNPDDTIALWCAAHSPDVELVGVSTVDGDVALRASVARTLIPEVDVVAGAPAAERLATVDALLGIGPWTNIAALSDSGMLPPRVVLMGGVLGSVKHRGEVVRIEHNVGTDPVAAAHLLRSAGGLIVVPLDATARVTAHPKDEDLLTSSIPYLGEQLQAWRAVHGPLPLVLHDPAALLIAMGERIARTESRRLVVEPDGVMLASVDGPLQRVVAYVNADATRSRVAALAASG